MKNTEIVPVNRQLQALMQVSENLSKGMVRQEQMINTVIQDVDDLKKFRDETWTINTYQQFELKQKAHSHAAELIREQRPGLGKAEFNAMFKPMIRALWREFKPAFQVPRYSMTRVLDFERAIDWVEHWKPIKLAYESEHQSQAVAQ